MLEIVREADAVLVADEMCQNINKRIGAILETVADRYRVYGSFECVTGFLCAQTNWVVRRHADTLYVRVQGAGQYGGSSENVNIHSPDADA